jgi:DNA-binding NarL/FixJ family response regulator
MKTCLICDDHTLVREALAGTVRLGWPDAAITEVGDFPQAWSQAVLGHDLCIVDLMMPGAGPIAGVQGLRRAAPDMPILVVTGTEDDTLLLDLLDLGIAGFAPKTASGALIEAALRLIEAGGRYLPARLAEIAAARAATAAQPPPPTGEDPPQAAIARLTDRQVAVLRLVADGLTNKEVAQALGMAPATVKSHLAHVQAFLGAKNRTDASLKAQALKLL